MGRATPTDHAAEAGFRHDFLYRSSSGSLSFCPVCRTFGLAFGSLHLGLNPGAVLALDQLLERLSVVELEKGRRHAVRLQGTPATLLLARRELTGLRRILREGQDLARTLRAEDAQAACCAQSGSWVH